MCNAWNHPPGCTCGWGGEGHLGRAAGKTASGILQSWFLGFTDRASYCNPNATCPVCAAPVYFYQSPDGGRVFFDDLGPPWPKHPCTNRREQQVLKLVERAPIPAVESKRSGTDSLSWQKTEWEPLLWVTLQKSSQRVTRVCGQTSLKSFRLYVPYVNFHQFAPWFIQRCVDGATYVTTVCSASARSNKLIHIELPAFETENLAIAYVTNHIFGSGVRMRVRGTSSKASLGKESQDQIPSGENRTEAPVANSVLLAHASNEKEVLALLKNLHVVLRKDVPLADDVERQLLEKYPDVDACLLVKAISSHKESINYLKHVAAGRTRFDLIGIKCGYVTRQQKQEALKLIREKEITKSQHSAVKLHREELLFATRKLREKFGRSDGGE